MAMCSDKDAAGFIAEIAKSVRKIIFTKADTPRASEARELAEKAPKGIEKEICANPLSAVEKALDNAGENGLVIATGSLYLVGTILKKRIRRFAGYIMISSKYFFFKILR